MAPYRQNDTSPVLKRLWLEDYRKRPPSEAGLSLPTNTQRKSGKPSIRLWPKILRKEVHILFSTFQAFTQTRWHKRRDGTPSFHRHTMFKLYQKFRHELEFAEQPFHHVRDDFDFGFSASLSSSWRPFVALQSPAPLHNVVQPSAKGSRASDTNGYIETVRMDGLLQR